jgi:hypothetical protein
LQNTSSQEQTLQNTTATIQKSIENKKLQGVTPKIEKLISRSIDIKRIEQLILLDPELKAKYETMLENYKNTIGSLDEYVTSKNKKDLTQTKKDLVSLQLSLKALQNPEKGYVEKVKNKNDQEIFKPKNEKLLPITNKIEKVLIPKLDKLLQSKKITKEEYKQAV